MQATPAAQFLKLSGLGKTISSNFLKIEQKVDKLTTAVAKFERNVGKTYLKATAANAKFLKITDAKPKFLKITDANAKFLKITDAQLKYLPASAAGGFYQGNGSVVSGAVASVSTRQQLLSLPGGIIVVSVENTPGAGSIIVVHNGTANTLLGAVSMGDGSVSQALSLSRTPTRRFHRC